MNATRIIAVVLPLIVGSGLVLHLHPGEAIVYVVEGLLQYELDGKQQVTLKVGDVLFIPYGTIHAVKNVGVGKAASSSHTSSKEESRSSHWPSEHLGRAFCEPTLA